MSLPSSGDEESNMNDQKTKRANDLKFKVSPSSQERSLIATNAFFPFSIAVLLLVEISLAFTAQQHVVRDLALGVFLVRAVGYV